MVASSLCLSNSPVCSHSHPSISSQPLLSFSHSLKPFLSKSKPVTSLQQHKRDNAGFVVKSQALDFSGTFFEGGFGSDDDPTSPSVSTALEDKPEPQCPPGHRQYETMAVLRPDMSEDERLGLTQTYEELLVAGGGMYVEVFNRGVIPLAYSIRKKNKAGETTLTWIGSTFFSLTSPNPNPSLHLSPFSLPMTTLLSDLLPSRSRRGNTTVVEEFHSPHKVH